MEIRENGKVLKCRILASWRTENGALAHQLQVIDTGEVLTTVEDGPATVMDVNGQRVRAQSTRIFHWGRSKTAPPGCPVPPTIVSGNTTITPLLKPGPAQNSSTTPVPVTTAQQTPATTASPSLPKSYIVSEGPEYLVDVTPGAYPKPAPQLLPRNASISPTGPQRPVTQGPPFPHRGGNASRVISVPTTSGPQIVTAPENGMTPAAPSPIVQGPPVGSAPMAVGPRETQARPGIFKSAPSPGPSTPAFRDPTASSPARMMVQEPMPQAKPRLIDRLVGRPTPATVVPGQTMATYPGQPPSQPSARFEGAHQRTPQSGSPMTAQGPVQPYWTPQGNTGQPYQGPQSYQGTPVQPGPYRVSPGQSGTSQPGPYMMPQGSHAMSGQPYRTQPSSQAVVQPGPYRVSQGSAPATPQSGPYLMPQGNHAAVPSMPQQGHAGAMVQPGPYRVSQGNRSEGPYLAAPTARFPAQGMAMQQPATPSYETMARQPSAPSLYGSPANLPRAGVVQRPTNANSFPPSQGWNQGGNPNQNAGHYAASSQQGQDSMPLGQYKGHGVGPMSPQPQGMYPNPNQQMPYSPSAQAQNNQAPQKNTVKFFPWLNKSTAAPNTQNNQGPGPMAQGQPNRVPNQSGAPNYAQQGQPWSTNMAPNPNAGPNAQNPSQQVRPGPWRTNDPSNQTAASPVQGAPYHQGPHAGQTGPNASQQVRPGPWRTNDPFNQMASGPLQGSPYHAGPQNPNQPGHLPMPNQMGSMAQGQPGQKPNQYPGQYPGQTGRQPNSNDLRSGPFHRPNDPSSPMNTAGQFAQGQNPANQNQTTPGQKDQGTQDKSAARKLFNLFPGLAKKNASGANNQANASQGPSSQQANSAQKFASQPFHGLNQGQTPNQFGQNQQPSAAQKFAGQPFHGVNQGQTPNQFGQNQQPNAAQKFAGQPFHGVNQGQNPFAGNPLAQGPYLPPASYQAQGFNPALQGQPNAFNQGSQVANPFLPGQNAPPMAGQATGQGPLAQGQPINPFLMPGNQGQFPYVPGQSGMNHMPGHPGAVAQGVNPFVPGQPTNPFMTPAAQAQNPFALTPPATPNAPYAGANSGFLTQGPSSANAQRPASPLAIPHQTPAAQAQRAAAHQQGQNTAKSQSSQQASAANQSKKFGDRWRDLIQGKDTKAPSAQEASGKGQGATAGNERTPFSTAVTSNAKTTDAAKTAASKMPASVQASSGPPKADWRRQWGRAPAPKNQQPGQATVDQDTGKGFTVSSLPPTAQSSVLFDPDRVGLGEDKLGVQRTAFQQKEQARKNDKKESKRETAQDVRMPPPIEQPKSVVQAQAPAQGQDQPQVFQPAVPLGAQSVMAASNGLVQSISYVPVPLVTIPNPIRPPTPPSPKMPEAPQPTQYINAFTTPPSQNQGQPNTPPAYLPPISAHPMATHPMYAYPMYVPNPYLAYRHGMNPYAYPVPQRPMAMVNHPLHYAGPMPPNPVAYQPTVPAMPPPHMMPNQMMPPQYAQMPPMVPPTAYMPPLQYNPAGQASASATGVQQQLAVLREAPSPAQREMAVSALTGADWRSQPYILEAIATAARSDPAASVRVACCNALVRMNANVGPALSTLQALKTDPDQRVRFEAEQSLIRLTGAAPATAPAIRPVQAQ